MNKLWYNMKGDKHTVSLKSDGTVVGTGLNYYGTLNFSGWNNIVLKKK